MFVRAAPTTPLTNLTNLTRLTDVQVPAGREDPWHHPLATSRSSVAVSARLHPSAHVVQLDPDDLYNSGTYRKLLLMTHPDGEQNHGGPEGSGDTAETDGPETVGPRTAMAAVSAGRVDGTG